MTNAVAISLVAILLLGCGAVRSFMWSEAELIPFEMYECSSRAWARARETTPRLELWRRRAAIDAEGNECSDRLSSLERSIRVYEQAGGPLSFSVQVSPGEDLDAQLRPCESNWCEVKVPEFGTGWLSQSELIILLPLR